MAGAGVRVFTAGSPLLAAQLNTYLMDQVIAYFQDSAARDAAFGGIGEPELTAGRVCYLFSDNKLYLYGNDNAWTEIGAKIDPLEVDEGKLADSAVTSAKIADGTILNIDINASAAIALSKLATGTIGTVVLHNASGVPTATALSGDVTVTSSGVTAIGTGVIVDADVHTTANIALSKLASTGTLTATTFVGALTGTATNASKIGNRTVSVQSATPTSPVVDDIWFQIP
jgi:hypothetical protein